MTTRKTYAKSALSAKETKSAVISEKDVVAEETDGGGGGGGGGDVGGGGGTGDGGGGGGGGLLYSQSRTKTMNLQPSESLQVIFKRESEPPPQPEVPSEVSQETSCLHPYSPEGMSNIDFEQLSPEHIRLFPFGSHLSRE